MIWAPAWASRTVLSCTWSRFPWFAASSSPHTSKWVPDGMAAPLLLCLPGLAQSRERLLHFRAPDAEELHALNH